MTTSETALIIFIALATLCACITFMQKRREYHTQRDRLQLAELRGLTPEAFEAYVARLFKRMGYWVIDTPNTKDHGVDVVALKEGRKVVIQCKRYGEGRVVGEPVVRDMLGIMQHERAAVGVIVTTGQFSGKAREWAAKHGDIVLLDGEELTKLDVRGFPNRKLDRRG